MIKKVKEGYKVVSENGKKNLGGPYKTKAAAEKRLRQVNFSNTTKVSVVSFFEAGHIGSQNYRRKT